MFCFHLSKIKLRNRLFRIWHKEYGWVKANGKNGELERDCRLFEDFYLDIFIYSEETVKTPDTSLIRIKDGVVLRQKDSIGDGLLAKIKSIFNAGPTATPAWEKHEINTWVMKMLNRAKQNDIEGNFRRH